MNAQTLSLMSFIHWTGLRHFKVTEKGALNSKGEQDCFKTVWSQTQDFYQIY